MLPLPSPPPHNSSSVCAGPWRSHQRFGCLRAGSFAEAFRYGQYVFKIVPIDGSRPYNGAPQKTAQELLSETLVSLTLSALHPAGAWAAGFIVSHSPSSQHGRWQLSCYTW